ncbi:hypothetical protein EC968_001388 [Mortierella alpina]|nr:hypothetical protein EC968_001388 [Mortierella alpina]
MPHSLGQPNRSAMPDGIPPQHDQHPTPHPPSRQDRPQPYLQQEQPQQRPGSVLGALSISLYQSLSFSRSPSFERTRYIASTCTFIAIIYLRTLHCLFFGTGALSCAVLANCLKHIIRQPRPERVDLTVEEHLDYNAVTAYPPPSLPPSGDAGSPSSRPAATVSGTDTRTIHTTSTLTSSSAHTATDTLAETSVLDYMDESVVEPHAESSSHTLSLAPVTSLQQEQVNSANGPKTQTGNQRIRRQRRRKVYLRFDYGMPSSHAQLVAFFVTYISLQLILMEPEGSLGQWFLIMLLELYGWSVVWSRIQVGRHSVSQVLVGAAIGTVYGIVWFAIWSWKVEEMIQHWQWMDRYGVIQVRKMWKQFEMDEAVTVGGSTQYMIRRLVEAGYCVYQLEYGIGLGGWLMGLGDIRNSAHEVQSWVTKVLSATGADRVDMVGYSEGSVVMMYYLKQLDGDRFVHSAVGVAPVLHGTTLQGYTDILRSIGFLCKACVQLIPNSTFLQDLYKDGLTSVPSAGSDGGGGGGPRYMMLMTNQDEIITPYTSGFLESDHATNVVLEEICPTAIGGVPPLEDLDKSPFLPALLFNHVRILFSPVTFATVDSFLDPTNARTPLDCRSS